MILLAARDLARQFDAEPVFRGVSFEVRPGEKVGLVGPNGSGKTTLLHILAGQDEPDVGAVERHPTASVAILEQEQEFAPDRTLLEEVKSGLGHLYELQDQAHALAEELARASDAEELDRLHKQYDALHLELDRLDAYHIDHRVEEVLHGLGFDRAEHDRPLRTFSGGQQNRAILGRLLLAAPDVMLLDEPTNHLDIAATEWLEDFLARTQQALVVVSHDRYFLDRVTQRTLEIFRGGVNEYAGNFSAYWTQHDERLKVLQRTYEKQQEFIAKTEDFIRRNAYGQKHAQAKDREKKLERLERVDIPPDFDEPPMGFPEPTRTGDWVLRAEGVSKGFGKESGVRSQESGGPQRSEVSRQRSEAPGPSLQDSRLSTLDSRLFTDLSLQVDRGDRIGILGPNGSGKTTLVRVLLGELPPDTGRVRVGAGVKIGYFDQQLTSVDPSLDAVEAVRPADDPQALPGPLRALLARFGVKGELGLQTVGNMSGGEKTKVALARLAALKPNVMVLDEPTNHLDFWSSAALERSLREWDGTVLFVSHDRYFLDQVATKVIVLEDGACRTFEGNYTDYQHFLRATAAHNDSQPSDAALNDDRSAATRKGALGSVGDKTASTRRKRRFPYRKVEDIEADVAARESRVAELQSAMADPAVLRDGERIRTIRREFEQAQAALAQLLEHWEEALELN
jgi:ATP-binding cassette subfamily F protein 3